MNNAIIDKSDPGIVVKETSISISDEKLRGMLSKTYETAQQDCNSKKIYDHYPILLSISSTLFLTLISSTFNDIGKLNGETITILAIIIFVLSTIIGFVFLAIHVSNKTRSDTSKRDQAVENIFNKYLPS